jgi:hypothetical protein
VVVNVSDLAICRIRMSGGIDGYAKIDNPLKGNPFVHCPLFVQPGNGPHGISYGPRADDAKVWTSAKSIEFHSFHFRGMTCSVMP